MKETGLRRASCRLNLVHRTIEKSISSGSQGLALSTKDRADSKRQDREKGEGTRERRQGYLFHRTKAFLWIERRQT